MEAYLLKSNIALIIFYALYRLIIYRQSAHEVKRFFGIGLIAFSALFLLAPSISIDPSAKVMSGFEELAKTTETLNSTFAFELPKERMSTFMIIYLVGVCLFSIRFVVGIFGILRLYRKSEISKKWGFTLVETNHSISPFSFFNYLFIQKGERKKNDLQPIIEHERVHKDQFHSADVLFLELISIFFWFNPFVWILKKDIKASHEFLADNHVINNGYDKLEYQDLLFEARTGVSFRSANYLSNQTSLKQRFNYMEKRTFNSKKSYLRAGIVLVAMVVTASLSSFSVLPQASSSDRPDFKVYTTSGELDEEKGIPKNTKEIFVRAVPTEKTDMKYRVSDVNAILVSGGQGVATLRAQDRVPIHELTSKISLEQAYMIVLEVKEYEVKVNDKIEKVKLKKPYFFSIKTY